MSTPKLIKDKSGKWRYAAGTGKGGQFASRADIIAAGHKVASAARKVKKAAQAIARKPRKSAGTNVAKPTFSQQQISDALAAGFKQDKAGRWRYGAGTGKGGKFAKIEDVIAGSETGRVSRVDQQFWNRLRTSPAGSPERGFLAATAEAWTGENRPETRSERTTIIKNLYPGASTLEEAFTAWVDSAAGQLYDAIKYLHEGVIAAIYSKVGWSNAEIQAYIMELRDMEFEERYDEAKRAANEFITTYGR